MFEPELTVIALFPLLISNALAFVGVLPATYPSTTDAVNELESHLKEEVPTKFKVKGVSPRKYRNLPPPPVLGD